MTVSGLSNVLNAGASAVSGGGSATNAQQDSFMKMLIAQLRYQDPLNPMDNAQMTSQLAQLNMVTGINQLNTTLSGLANNDLNSQAVSAAGILGHEVMIPGDALSLSNGQANLGFELPKSVDKLTLTVLDADGNSVYTQDLGAQKSGQQTLAWDGSTDAGTKAADGQYRFKLNAESAGSAVNSTSLTVGKVQNISINAGVLKAHVEPNGDVNFSDIRKIF